MNTFKQTIYTLGLGTLFIASSAQAQATTQIARHANIPSPLVTQITSNTAVFDIPESVRSSFAPGEREQTYFEYYKTNQVCIAILDSKSEIAISPTPAECLPKKTQKGIISIKISELTPNTSYTVVYKRDNTINCITTPCPTNESVSAGKEFTTGATTSSNNVNIFSKNIGFKSRGEDVRMLQEILIQRGFMTGSPTGYFGKLTLRAVKDLQKSLDINPTGFVGLITRTALNSENYSNISEVTFEGRVTAVSTGCFSDGECSISVDGKKVITTIGWSQAVSGSVIGSSIGDTQIGSYAKVYARKVGDELTLYGNSKYYIEILYFK